jgi:voltage-gated potassium channel
VGRFFTIVLATVGILAIGVIITRTTQLLVARSELKVRQMQRLIRNISGHYVICGFGRIGSRIAENLAQAGKSFVVIERKPEVIKHIADLGYQWVEGDAEKESTLLEAGIERARGLISTLKADADNVFVTLIARELNPNLFILSRAYSSESVAKLQRAGANRAVSPYELGADRMAQYLIKPKVNRFLELALHASGYDLSLEEVVVPADSPIAGKTLKESRLREDYGAIVVATIGAGDNIAFNPDADCLLTPGITLIVLGEPKRLKELHEHDVVS